MEGLITLDIEKFKPFVVEKLLISLIHRHKIRNISITDEGFSITTESHIVSGTYTANADIQCICIWVKRNNVNLPLIKLCYSEYTRYSEMMKTTLSTFDADVISPLNNIFEDWVNDRLSVISFSCNDIVTNLFRYSLAYFQQNKFMVAKSVTGFIYVMLDSDMKTFLNNRDNGVNSNIILRRVNNLNNYRITTPEMPFQPAIELFEDEINKPVEKPYNGSTIIIEDRPLYWMKSPTKDCYIIIFKISGRKCKSGYMDEEPNMCYQSWSTYGVRTTNIHYIKDLRRYQIIRGKDCIDITHLMNNKHPG